ncbi:MAG: serine hydrolase [bacterium]
MGSVAILNVNGHKKIEQENACREMKTILSRNLLDSISGKLLAHAVNVFDFTTDRPIYTENDALPLPLASLTKLMTVRVALKSVSLDDTYQIKPADITFDANSGFVAGDVFSLKDIIKATLIASSNNAAMMVARSTKLDPSHFISLMNFEAQNLQLPTLHYDSVSGLDTDTNQPTAVGSAHDILTLLYRDALEMPDVFSFGTIPSTTIRSRSGRAISLTNTDQVLNKLALLKASKTGYTDTAGGNLAILWQGPTGHTLGAVVLGSTVLGRFSDIVTLYNAANIYTTAEQGLPNNCK